MKINCMVIVEEGWFVGLIGNYLLVYVMIYVFDYFDVLVLNCIGKDVLMFYVVNFEKYVLVIIDEVIVVVK